MNDKPHFLVVELNLLTGRYVAADPVDRLLPEWPPHPGRVFMAMAAGCFERGSDPGEVAALIWLEQLPAPGIYCEHSNPRSNVENYVPVNDKLSIEKSLLQSVPGMTRLKKERVFATTIPENNHVIFKWDLRQTEPSKTQIQSFVQSLDRLCGEVIRVGHSSSLVSMSAHVEKSSAEQYLGLKHRYVPSSIASTETMRVPSAGEFERLIVGGRREEIAAFFELGEQIEAAKGKAKMPLKDQFKEVFGIAYNKNLRPPEPAPAIISTWQGYRIEDDSSGADRGEGELTLRGELLILSKHDGPNLTLVDTPAVVGRLREALMSRCPVKPIPSWLSGHYAPAKDGSNSRPTDAAHLAFVPLPYVGGAYGDGHLMGVGLIIPPSVPTAQLRSGLGPALYDSSGEATQLELKLGSLGVWSIQVDQRQEPPLTLRSITWTKPARRWLSVTPVVLDRFPKKDLRKDRNAWRAEVSKLLIRACEHAGLPTPKSIDFDTTAFLDGVPRSTRKTAVDRLSDRRPVGEGFPPPRVGRAVSPRPQVHVELTFDQPVAGPICIGAGRFFGYGFCKPVDKRRVNQ